MANRVTETFNIIVPDRCMTETLQKGDLAIVDRRRRKIRNGHIYALRNHNQIEIRRLHALSGWLIRASCDNPIYPAQELTRQELEILGEVIWFGRPTV